MKKYRNEEHKDWPPERCFCNLCQPNPKDSIKIQTEDIQDWLNYLVETGYIHAKIDVSKFVSEIREDEKKKKRRIYD